MKKRFAISALMVLLLLIVSQIIWIRQVAERDKSRFKAEVSTSINDIVKYQATKQTFDLYNINPQSPSITLERVQPDAISANAKSYGSYETKSYREDASLARFLEAAMTEKLLIRDTLNLYRIDSLFQSNFPYISELSAYSFQMKEKDRTTDSLYFGVNATRQRNDTTKGVYTTIPLGTSGNYRFVSHFIFKPATATKQMTVLVILSGVAVVAVAVILFVLLFQLQQQIDRLQSQEKRVRGIIHDLKSPLSYIYSMLGFFEMEEENSFLTEGKSRVKRLSDNIERMLSEVKLNEKKNAVLQREPYDLAQHCREIADDLQVIYKEKEITTTFNIAPEACTIYVDPFYFESCLRNLLDNAVKYSDNAPVITVTSRKEKNRILISVTDHGIGIPKKEQRKVFNDFYRSQRQPSAKGHGIGLSSVKQIVKAHGGSMKLESKERKGSVFIIILPAKL
ncbi:MAG: hypothetical protein BGO34_12550 [Bacteroidia bacterium 44-10]|nr:MAG: hypothetical protein BGO34_12550 [Bacteroidia bacterium 44-10]